MRKQGRADRRNSPPAWRVAPGHCPSPDSPGSRTPRDADTPPIFLLGQDQPAIGGASVGPKSPDPTPPQRPEPQELPVEPPLFTQPLLSPAQEWPPFNDFSWPVEDSDPPVASQPASAPVAAPQPAQHGSNDLTTTPRPGQEAGPSTQLSRLPIDAPQRPAPLLVRGSRPQAWPVERPFESYEPIDTDEAKTLAARFAADWFSWDEEDPHRRAEVLREYLSDPGAATLGWDGTGRQRAELVLPGRTLHLEDGRVVVEVTVRVATYERAYPSPPHDLAAAAQNSAPPRSLGPSSAPDAGDPAWRLACSYWSSLAPPIAYDRRSRRLVVAISPTTETE